MNGPDLGYTLITNLYKKFHRILDSKSLIQSNRKSKPPKKKKSVSITISSKSTEFTASTAKIHIKNRYNYQKYDLGHEKKYLNRRFLCLRLLWRIGAEEAVWEEKCEDASEDDADSNRNCDSRYSDRRLTGSSLPTPRHRLQFLDLQDRKTGESEEKKNSFNRNKMTTCREKGKP